MDVHISFLCLSSRNLGRNVHFSTSHVYSCKIKCQKYRMHLEYKYGASWISFEIISSPLYRKIKHHWPKRILHWLIDLQFNTNIIYLLFQLMFFSVLFSVIDSWILSTTVRQKPNQSQKNSIYSTINTVRCIHNAHTF